MALFPHRFRVVTLIVAGGVVASVIGLGGSAAAIGEGVATCSGVDSLGSINNAPLAVDDETWTAPGDSVVIDVLFNDRDFDGDELTVSEVGQAGHGSATLDDEVTYSPGLDFEGFDVFTYTVSDGKCGSHTASVRVQVSQEPPPPDEATPEPPVVGVVAFTG